MVNQTDRLTYIMAYNEVAAYSERLQRSVQRQDLQGGP